MTTIERLNAHRQIEQDNARKLQAWKKKQLGRKIDAIDFLYERAFRVLDRLEAERKTALQAWEAC